MLFTHTPASYNPAVTKDELTKLTHAVACAG